MQISGTPISPRRYIQLNGVIGRFTLPKKQIKVNYFSTVASSNKQDANGYELLKELKPMRERVKASEIKDLSSLLQRNLDDYRVAYELVPYLIKQQDIAFFGAILGVLIPQNFLNQAQGAKYPLKTESTGANGNRKITFEDKWSLEVYKIGANETNLGLLSIDLSDVEIVVLDGQHRANAFRVICGAFDDRDSSVYPAFYKDIPITDNVMADLPITLVWFENETAEFDPRLVSRRLFVDVNNTAKRVSKSRRILLNDSEVPSLLTRFFYSAIATTKSFSVDSFSLFHSEFDKDTDTNVSSSNVLSITNPEFIHEIFSWLVLGSRRFSNLPVYKSKDDFKNNVVVFGKIFNSETFNQKDIDPFGEILNSKFVILSDVKKIATFENEYNRILHSIVYSLFNEFDLFKQHYKACVVLEKWYKEEMNTTQRLVWEEVFQGGEGLYYTFKNKEMAANANASLKSYLMAMDEIEARFKKERCKFFDGVPENRVNSAFDSASTKAFQVALFMAFDYFATDSTYESKLEEFIGRINRIKPSNWIVVLNDVRDELISGVDPKLWPSYQNFILRLIQKDFEYYDKGNFMESPDGQIFKKHVKRQFDAWWDSTDDVSEESDLTIEVITIETINKWSKNAKEIVEKLVVDSGGTIIPDVNEKEHGLEIVKKQVNEINPPL